jgi:hypothetical protein
MTKQLLMASTRSLQQYDSPDVKTWSSMHKIVPASVLLTDRTGFVKPPFNIKLYDKFKMPTDFSEELSYEQCCERRAVELYELSKRINKPLLVFYSGGIDSTLMLITFLKVIPENDRERLIVAMDWDSIKEYPLFFEKHIRGKLKTLHSAAFDLYFTKEYIILGGEFNDQLMGTDVVVKIQNIFSFDLIKERYTRQNITDFYVAMGMERSRANHWFDLIDGCCKNAPIPIVTVFDYLWWFNFNFKWQSVFFRMLMRCRSNMQHTINQEFVDTYYQHFYGEDYFQIWSMKNQHLKIRDEWQTYKFHAKDLILDYTKDNDYYQSKVKVGSLYKLFTLRRTPRALTTDYEFIYDLNAEDFYVSENDYWPLPSSE